MKIIIFHNACFFGGGERHTIGLAVVLAASGHKVVILDCGDGVYEQWKPTHKNINIITDRFIARNQNIISCSRRIFKYSCDLALVISGGLQGFTLAAEAAIVLRYRRVIRVEHGCVDAIESYARRLWWGFLPGLNYLANLARFRRFARSIMIPRVVVVSYASKNRLVKYCYMRTLCVHVVHNGTDCEALAQQPRHQLRDSLGISAACTLFICSGRLSHEKGVDVAIAAFAQCKLCCGSQAKLLIVGTGSLEANLKAMTLKLGLADDVLFVGFQRDVGSYLNASDCLLLPSLSESFPLTKAGRM